MVKVLKEKHGIECESKNPLWMCIIKSPQQYLKLPNLKFQLAEGSGKTREVVMPRHAYMKIDLFASAKDDNGNKLMVAKLLLHPIS